MASRSTAPRGKRPSRARTPLSRDRIISAALELADERGDFSMRALGAHLGVDPMAVYRHFRDKDALLDAAVDAALATLRPPAPGDGSALERLRSICIEFRSALTAHPGIATRVSTTQPTLGPHTVALTEATFGLLVELGLGRADATKSFLMLIRFITGAVSAEERARAEETSDTPWQEQMRAAYASLPPEQFPNLAAMAEEVARTDLDIEFEYGLDLVLEALARRGNPGPSVNA